MKIKTLSARAIENMAMIIKLYCIEKQCYRCPLSHINQTEFNNCKVAIIFEALRQCGHDFDSKILKQLYADYRLLCGRRECRTCQIGRGKRCKLKMLPNVECSLYYILSKCFKILTKKGEKNETDNSRRD